MKLATTTEDFGRATGFDYDKCVQYTCEAGFNCIDLSMYVIKENDPLFFNQNWQYVAEKLKALGEELGAQYVQAHSPSGNPHLSKAHYDEYLWKTKRSIEVCGILGIPNIVVHSGFRPGMTKKEYHEESGRFFQELFPLMEKFQVNVLCENGKKVEDHYNLYSGQEMRDFIEHVNHPLFHGCWDTGHANMNGPQYNDIVAVGKDLYALHINDNRGELDEHIIPFFGTINMDEVMSALADIDYKGYFTFETCYALRPGNVYFGPRRTFEKSNRLYEPTLEMQKDMSAFLYKMGEHILKAYNCYG